MEDFSNILRTREAYNLLFRGEIRTQSRYEMGAGKEVNSMWVECRQCMEGRDNMWWCRAGLVVLPPQGQSSLCADMGSRSCDAADDKINGNDQMKVLFHGSR